MIVPDRKRAAELNIDHLSHVPVIWTRDWKLFEDALDYLIARATGRWVPGQGQKSLYAYPRAPSENSLYAYGRDLEHFLTYCERHGLDWRSISYAELLETYQGDMKCGSYSVRKKPLAPSTINRRMSTVGDFLTFGATFGLRQPFEVGYETIFNPKAERRTSGNQYEICRRIGRVRDDPDDLRLPTRLEMKNWLDGIKAGHPGLVGITAYLMCRSAVETGMRAEEVVMFRADQLPNPNNKDRNKPDAQSISIKICFGTKGGRKAGDPEKRGKARSIPMGRDWLGRLHDYKRITREVALRKFRKLNPGKADPKELFLSPYTGESYSYERFREFWVQSGLQIKTIPYVGWSPHGGRHAWACYQVLEQLNTELDRLKIDAALTGGAGHVPSVTWVNQMAGTLIDQFIRPVLGHVSEKTTERYLRWLRRQVEAEHYTKQWSHWLDGDEDDVLNG